MSNEEKKTKNWFMRHKIITAILVIIVLIIVGSAMSGGKSNSPTSQSNNQVQQQPAPTPAITVSAAKLVADYEANGVAADEMYKNKMVEVSGTIKDIGKDILDSPYISLESNNIVWSVQCMFDKSDASKLVNLSKNQKITLTGVVSGELGNVIIKNCQIK